MYNSWVLKFSTYQYSAERVGGIMRSGDYMPIVTIEPDVIKRLEEFAKTHTEDIGPYIGEKIGELLDQIERAENG